MAPVRQVQSGINKAGTHRIDTEIKVVTAPIDMVLVRTMTADQVADRDMVLVAMAV
jgi:hypothetical protein